METERPFGRLTKPQVFKEFAKISSCKIVVFGKSRLLKDAVLNGLTRDGSPGSLSDWRYSKFAEVSVRTEAARADYRMHFEVE